MKVSFNILKSIYGSLLDLLFPKFCLGCGKAGETMCLECIRSIERVQRDSSDGIYACFDYRDPLVKKAIWDLKYHKRSSVGHLLGKLMYENQIEEVADIRIYTSGRSICVIPVPLSKSRLKFRGYNQANMLARGFCDCGEDGLFEIITDAITKKDSPPQARINNRKRRLNNVKDCFEVVKKDAIKGRTIIVIDDVTTTGGTMTEIIKVLKKSGAKRVVGMALAH